MDRKYREVMEKVKYLRNICLPPAWIKSEEGIRKWKNMED